MGGSSGFPSFLSSNMGERLIIIEKRPSYPFSTSPQKDLLSVFPPPLGGLMRLVEEVFVKAKEDLICQSCGVDIPKGSNHLLESYVHHGVISTSHYCLNPKCNPPNNVRLKLFWGAIILSLSSWVIYFFYQNAGF